MKILMAFELPLVLTNGLEEKQIMGFSPKTYYIWLKPLMRLHIPDPPAKAGGISRR